MRLLTAVLATLAITACAPSAARLDAQEPAPDAPRTLHVSATASVQRAPDRATVHLAVETVAPEAGEASSRNAALMEAVLEAVTALGIEPSAIRTQRLDLRPRYDRRPDAAEPAIVAYQATNQVRVRVDAIDRVGAVVDAAVGAGANRVTGINFELSDPEAAYHEALRQAIAEARREADVAAGALGEPLGPPLRVSTGGFGGPVPRPMPEMAVRGMAAEMERAVPPVEAGELEVRASVDITYRLGS